MPGVRRGPGGLRLAASKSLMPAKPCKPSLIFAVALVVMVVFAITAEHAIADLLELQDGTQYEGRLVDRDTREVIFEIHIGSVRFKRTFAADDVQSIQTDHDENGDADDADAARPTEDNATSPPTDRATATTSAARRPADREAGPTYLRIPLHGTFGAGIDGPTLGQCLEYAQEARPDVVVVDIDSPGGMVATLVDVAQRLGQFSRDTAIPLVAFVNHEAFSAAALTTMAVPAIYATPDASIGAAMVINVGPGGSVTSVADGGDVAEKFLSAFRARVRGWVEQAGHDPLLSEAMIDPAVELHMAFDRDGRPRIFRGRTVPSNLPRDAQAELVIESGRLLTLTAAEAERVGLVRGVVDDLDQLGHALGYGDWRPLDDHAVQLMAERARLVADVEADYERSAKGLLTTLEHMMDGSAVQFGTVERGIKSLRTRITRIERLVEEHPFMAMQAMVDFPGGLTQLKIRCDEVLADMRQQRRDYIRSRRQ